MIGLLSGLIQSESDVIGGAAFILGKRLCYLLKKIREIKKKPVKQWVTLLGPCSEMRLNLKQCYKRGSGIEILITWRTSSNLALFLVLFKKLHGRAKDLAVGPEYMLMFNCSNKFTL